MVQTLNWASSLLMIAATAVVFRQNFDDAVTWMSIILPATLITASITCWLTAWVMTKQRGNKQPTN